MDGATLQDPVRQAPEPRFPRPRDVLELLKPVTWFPPMWAFMCGVVSSGVPLADRWGLLVAGMLLAGPLVCGNSQAINDWFDRHVDAINEPKRPIPSGRIPGRWGLCRAAGEGGHARAWGDVQAALLHPPRVQRQERHEGCDLRR